MKKNIAWLMIALFLSYDFYPLSRAYAQEAGEREEKPYIAVLDLEIKEGVPLSAQPLLSDSLRKEIFNTRNYKVVDRKNMESILKEQGFQLSDCTTTECAVEAGRLLGVEKMVTGNVGKLGETYYISVTITNVETGEVEGIADDQCPAEIDQLFDTVGRVARKITGLISGVPTPAVTLGGLNILSQPEGVVIFLDGRKMGETPRLLSNLKAGKHELTLSKPGYRYYTKKIKIPADEILTLKATLEEVKERKRWYKRWWVWALIVGAVGGGTAAAVIAARGEDEDTGHVVIAGGELP